MKPDLNFPKLNDCVYERKVNINVEKIDEEKQIIHAHFVDDLHDIQAEFFLDDGKIQAPKSSISFERAPFKVCLATEHLIQSCHGQTIQELSEKNLLNPKNTETNKRSGCFRQDEILQLIWSMLTQKLDSFQLYENAEQEELFPQNKDISVQVGTDILHIKLKTHEKINAVTELLKVQIQGENILKKIPALEIAQVTDLITTRRILKETTSISLEEKKRVQHLINLLRTNMLRFEVGLGTIRQYLSLPLDHPDKPNEPSGDFEIYRRMIDCHAFNNHAADTQKN